MKGTYIITSPERKMPMPGGAPGGAPAGGPPAGGPPAGGPPAGGPGGPGGAPGGRKMSNEQKLVWDGEKAVWTNEMGEDVVLEQFEELDGQLKFVAMAGPAPIEWTITKEGDGYTAVSHRGEDIHGNPAVDTVCKVVKQ